MLYICRHLNILKNYFPNYHIYFNFVFFFKKNINSIYYHLLNMLLKNLHPREKKKKKIEPKLQI
jgi:hypothetical protein